MMVILQLACGVRTKFRDFEFSMENNVILGGHIELCVIRGYALSEVCVKRGSTVQHAWKFDTCRKGSVSPVRAHHRINLMTGHITIFQVILFMGTG